MSSSLLRCEHVSTWQNRIRWWEKVEKSQKREGNFKDFNLIFILQGLIRINFVVCRFPFSHTLRCVEAIDSWKQLIFIMAGLFFSIATFCCRFCRIFFFSLTFPMKRRKKRPKSNIRIGKWQNLLEIFFSDFWSPLQIFSVINVQTLKFESGQKRQKSDATTDGKIEHRSKIN